MTAKTKGGMGDSTEHKDNRQNERGSGASNHPLKKSTANPNPPLLEERKPHGAKAPVKQPNLPLGEKGHVAVDEKSPAGRNSTGSTFRAPRKETGSSATETGYTNLGKA